VSEDVGRFAPSTTGPAHPGTLLAALLCWLDVRVRGGRVVLRLEDLDPQRSTAAKAGAMEADLAWLGLDWDVVERQSEARADHEAALDRLADRGLLYPCGCSRADLRASGERTPDGGFRYTGHCRGRPLPAAGWRASDQPLRVRLPAGVVTPRSEDDTPLSLAPVEAFGDPVVRRRDGAIAYHLASVVDDARAGVTRVVRGRDLANGTALQDALRGRLGLPRPVHRHHLLLLERRGEKLAKLHGAVGLPELRDHYPADRLVGLLARIAGLRDDAGPVAAAALVGDFDWNRVGRADRLLRWTGTRLEVCDVAEVPDPGPANRRLP